MNWFDTISMAQSNLWRSKARTILTLLAICVGATTITLTLALASGMKNFMQSQLGGYVQKNVLNVYPQMQSVSCIGGSCTVSQGNDGSGGGNSGPTSPFDTTPREYVEPKGKQMSMDEANDMMGMGPSVDTGPPKIALKTINKVKLIPGVLGIYPTYAPYIKYLKYGKGKKYQIYSADIAFPGYNKAVLSTGQMVMPTDMENVVLGYQYLQVFGLASPKEALGKKLTLAISTSSGATRKYEFTIAGVTTNNISSPPLIMGYDLAKKLSRAQSTDRSIMTADVVVDPKLNQSEVDKIKTKMKALKLDANDMAQAANASDQALNVVKYVLLGFGAISLLAATIGIVNTLLMAVFERTREIGLMKALGMGRFGIFAIFLAEAGAIGFWGGVAGQAIAYTIGRFANALVIKRLMMGFGDINIIIMTWPNILMVVGLTTFIGCLAGTIPAIKASKMNPVEALKYE